MRNNKEKKTIELHKDDQKYYEEEGNSTIYTTMNVWREMASDVYEFIDFTLDTAEQHNDGFVPVLDVKVGRKGEGGPIVHTYFKKSMVSELVIMADSAQPNNVKFATLAQELVRRMKNMSRTSTIGERADVSNKFMIKMWKSGHNEETRSQKVKAASRGYYGMVENEVLGVRKVNRSANEGKREREIKRVLGKTEWYQPKFIKEGGDDCKSEEEEPVTPKTWRSHTRTGIGRREYNGNKSPYEAVLFIPCTPGAVLRRALQAADDKFSKVQKIKSMKFVEEGGTAIAELLVKSNPFKLAGGGTIPFARGGWREGARR